MATPRLSSSLLPTHERFWTEPGARILLPDDLAALAPALEAALEAAGPGDAVVFTSSGSSGVPKFTVLRRAALLESARMVTQWLGLGPADRLFGVLPLFHVGGFGSVARARTSGAALDLDLDQWNAARFVEGCRTHGSTVSSLVPTQVFDLVRQDLRAPPLLRIVAVGGGVLDSELESEARHLGWPVVASYGMTETSSQVATARPGLRAPGPGWLPVIDGWEAAVDANGALRLRGPALFSGRLEPAGGSDWCFEPAPLEDGWFTTADLAEVEADPSGQVWLRPIGRTDDAVKIRGELVSLSTAQREIDGLARSLGQDPRRLAVIDVPDERTGKRLVLVAEGDAAPDLDRVVDQFNRRAPAYARIEGCVLVRALPRSALGKLRRTELKRLAAGA